MAEPFVTPADASGSVWVPWLEEPTSAAVMVDFDGTLAPIVEDPELALPAEGSVEVLSALAQRCGLVAVVSGRPVSFLSKHLGGIDSLMLVGLYGMERLVDGSVIVLEEALPWVQTVESIAAAADEQAPPGVTVERKTYSVCLHYRQAPEAESWVHTWALAAAGESGLVPHEGRCSVELTPPLSADKGTVVASLADGFRSACYLGDDIGDIPAFETLRALRQGGIHTVGVGVGSEEAPSELGSVIDIEVDGTTGVLNLLRALAGLEG